MSIENLIGLSEFVYVFHFKGVRRLVARHIVISLFCQAKIDAMTRSIQSLPFGFKCISYHLFCIYAVDDSAFVFYFFSTNIFSVSNVKKFKFHTYDRTYFITFVFFCMASIQQRHQKIHYSFFFCKHSFYDNDTILTPFNSTPINCFC